MAASATGLRVNGRRLHQLILRRPLTSTEQPDDPHAQGRSAISNVRSAEGPFLLLSDNEKLNDDVFDVGRLNTGDRSD